MKHYVLGTKNSPLLHEYLEKYFQKLRQDLREVTFLPFAKSDARNAFDPHQIDTLLSWECRDFILSPDTSSLINHIATYGVQNTGDSIRKLKQEINSFLAGDITVLTSKQGEKIWETNIKLTVSDNNPYNWRDAHPDHAATGGVMWWWEKSPQQWLEVYTHTFELLKKIDEWIYDELNMMIAKIIPLWTAYDIHNSASYKECIGHLYMWYTTAWEYPEINILEALIHESSHNKINLLMHFDPLILNDFSEKYYSPYRPDARHMHGCFLWLHAFVPTMYICIKAYQDGHLGENIDWLQKFLLYTLKNKICLRVVQKHAKLTTMWQEVVDELIQVMTMTQILLKQIWISADMLREANAAIKYHFGEVNKKYPNLEY